MPEQSDAEKIIEEKRMKRDIIDLVAEMMRLRRQVEIEERSALPVALTNGQERFVSTFWTNMYSAVDDSDEERLARTQHSHYDLMAC